MNGLRLASWAASAAVLAAVLVSGCAHDPPPRVAPAEEAIVMAPASPKAKPIPEIDGNKPLRHEKEIDTSSKATCIRTGRRGTICR